MTNDQKGMVNELLGYQPVSENVLITDLELKFLCDIQGRQGNLSGPQANSLGEIWAKVFGS